MFSDFSINLHFTVNSHHQLDGDAKKKEQEKNAKKIDALLEENPDLYKYATVGSALHFILSLVKDLLV